MTSMDELLLELTKSVPVIGVLLFWVRSERTERIAQKIYCQEQSDRHMRIVLRLVDKSMPDE